MHPGERDEQKVLVGRAPQDAKRLLRFAQSGEEPCPTTPNEKTSDRASTAMPRACSGDMYPTVP